MISPIFLSATIASLVASSHAISSGCGTDGPTSCSSDAASTLVSFTLDGKNATCCTETDGLILQTQFWDYSPATGPDDSWTIHGLWPDECNGGYKENCDPSRDYTDIKGLLSDAGATKTLSYMEKYWKNDPDDGSDEELWEHEWATHGTCYSTLEPGCLPSGGAKGAEAVAFFEQVVTLFKTLPTYKWLEDANITPGDDEYEADDVIAALTKGYGATPQVGCSDGALSSLSYYYHLKGSVIDGDFIAIDSPEKSSCSGKVKYPSKSGSSDDKRQPPRNVAAY